MPPRLIAVVGATGAQGIPVVRELVQSNDYTVRALTRDASSARFRALQSYGPVEAVVGTFASEKDLRATFRGAWGAFVNIDGFNSGEKTEMFWTIRAYELAIEEGVEFFVMGNLEYYYKNSGFRPEFRTGHLDGKGRIGEWILQQNHTNQHRMKAALLTTGPYMEMAISAHTPMAVTIENGIATWRIPLNEDGEIPFVSLDDCGYYAKWLFDDPDRANGLDLKVAIAHVSGADLASAFEKVTGHPAQFINTSFDEYFGKVWGLDPEKPAGYNADPKDPATLTLRQNFEGFWTCWRHAGGNSVIARRDYEMLDRVHPGRIKSAEEFFRREDEKGVREGKGSLWERVQPGRIGHVLKITEDGRTGTL